ncbi:hypothetical protein RHSIM_Rhsim04G0003500 [Rhododendron simsii]|uniref:Uncharacterized protein n=1 Tax=Rhododendron simsii TaxID=118357 RepID=A0A834H4G8_RHOSS|nr:hypothetical protein RHSIM_Rhsim04G0003500 [Rhododendron simsii]
MSILWEKSGTWRWIVRQTKESKPFFLAFATICGVVPGVIGYGVMQITNSRNQQLESHLRHNAPPDSLMRHQAAVEVQHLVASRMMGKVNKDRLAEYLGELQRKEDTNDRYVAALRGETLTRTPYVRIQPVPKESNSESNKQQQK